MRFCLRFNEETTVNKPLIENPPLFKDHPFTECTFYENSELQLRHLHYSRKSVQLDHYETKNAPGYQLHIIAKKPSYVLIALEEGKLQYRPFEKTNPTLTLQKQSCFILYADRGIYTVELEDPQNKFHVICLTPDLLYPLRDEFDELIQFMKNLHADSLLAMQSCRMDQTFRQQLNHVFYSPYSRHKDFNRHLLWELPKLLSAYKGLLKGKDRLTQDSILINDIIRYIIAQYRSSPTLSIQIICKKFPVSKKRLIRLFKQHHATTPMKYIYKLKIEYCSDLLLSSTKSVLEIAVELGYSDVNALTKSFKREMDMTPLQYRNKYGEPSKSDK